MLRKKCECGRQRWAKCPHFWHEKFKIDGTSREIHTGTADRAAAIVEGARRKIELRAALGAGFSRRCDLAKLAAAHIAESSAGRVSKERARVIEYQWAPVLRHFTPEFDPANLTFELIEAYRDKRRETVRGQTIEREIWSLKEGLKIAKRRGLIRDYPVPLDDWPRIGHDQKDERRAGKLHDPAVLQAVLAECDQDLRERIEFDARTGLRKHELLRLEYSWVEHPPQGLGMPAMLVVPAASAKTKKPRLIPLSPEALAILDTRHHRLGGARVFVGDRKKALYRAIAAAKKKHGDMPNITLRDMRHAFLTAGEFATKDRKAAADVAGHARLKTTEIYLHSDLARLAAFAAVAGDWWSAHTSPEGVPDGGCPTPLPKTQKGYFPSEILVGTTGIEPVTPTVSSDNRAKKPNKINRPKAMTGT